MYHPLLYSSVRKPRLPIVLCHGLYGFDVRGPFLGLEYQYWSTALDVLRKRVGAEVFVHGVPPTGSIKERAEVLHAFLSSERSGARGRQLNFIAHSMGGLDARYIISQIQPKEYTPASLTTLATPHRGSPFMDWCNANIGIGAELIEKMMLREQRAGTPDPPPRPPPYSLKAPLLRRKEEKKETEKEPNGSVPGVAALSRALASVSSALSSYILSVFDQPAYAMLSTQYMTRIFNPKTPDRPNVRYFSVAGRSKEISVFHPLWLPKLILDKAAASDSSGAQYDGSSEHRHDKLHGNDGLVSVGSADWGEHLGVMDGWDHWDMRGPGGPHRIRPATNRTSQPHPPPPPTLSARLEALRGTIGAWFASGKKPPTSAAAPAEEPHWNWREAVLDELEAPSTSTDDEPPPMEAAAYALSSGQGMYDIPAHEPELVQRLAEWIASHLPSHAQQTETEERNDSKMLLTYLSRPQTLYLPAPHTRPDDAPHHAKQFCDTNHAGDRPSSAHALRAVLQEPSGTPSEHRKPSSTAVLTTSLLEMFPFLLSHNVEVPNTPSHEVFERFWLALCRNLYEEGL